MPIDAIVVTVVVTIIFVCFGTVLAWGDRQTRECAIKSKESIPESRH